MWFPETTRQMVAMGAEVILHPTMTNTIDREVELTVARASAVMFQTYFFDVNSAGGLLGYGRSIILGPDGEILHQAGNAKECIPILVDFDRVQKSRRRGSLGLGQPVKSFRDTPVRFPLLRRPAVALPRFARPSRNVEAEARDLAAWRTPSPRKLASSSSAAAFSAARSPITSPSSAGPTSCCSSASSSPAAPPGTPPAS